MENHEESWIGEAARAGVSLSPDQVERLRRFVDELLKWNQRFNLTAITRRAEVFEKHVLDSLLLSPALTAGARLLDAGSGGGLPAVPLAIARPDLQVTAVDRTDKKVSFIEAVAARLGLRNLRGRQVRLEGDPVKEGVGPFDAAVSRAFAAPAPWLALARAYVPAGGRIVVTLGADEPSEAERAAALGTDRLLEARRYALPSGDRRGIWVVERV